MTTRIYAGIGARATPAATLRDMTVMAGWLARTGWHLATGGAAGADSAFAGGAPAGQRTLYLPWRGYNAHGGRTAACCPRPSSPPAWTSPRACTPPGTAVRAPCASSTRGTPPCFSGVSSTVRSMRSSRWSPGGAVTGGTGMALRIAAEHGVPVLNLAVLSPRAACERLLAIRRAT